MKTRKTLKKTYCEIQIAKIEKELRKRYDLKLLKRLEDLKMGLAILKNQ